jgi:hypothetical protein
MHSLSRSLTGPRSRAQRRPRHPLEGSEVMETFRNTIAPVLTIRHVAQAVAFYERAFETKRSTAVPTRTAGSSEMAIDGARF